MSASQTLVRGTKTTDDLMLLLGGRHYGAFMDAADRLSQEVPDFLDPLVTDFRQSSKLLALNPTSNLDHDMIFDAYKADVLFLSGRQSDFEQMIKSAVAASMKYKDNRSQISYIDGYDEHDRPRRRTKAEDWDTIKAHMPRMENIPLIDLSAERASHPAGQLLAELKNEVEAGINRLLRRICFWLDELVDREYIGLVAFTGSTAGHYYYFRPFVTEEEINRKAQETVSEDPLRPFGSRITYKTVDKRTYRVTESLERHDHHIVRAKIEVLEDFQQLIPSRILENLLNKTPGWLRSHLRVVSGEITKEEIRRRIVREHEETLEIVSVWKGSPAITIGPYALAGWSSDDIARDSSNYWRGRRVSTKETRRRRNGIIAKISLILLIVASAVFGVSQCTISQNQGIQLAYKRYQREHASGHKIFKVQQNQKITLPQGEILYYLGSPRNSMGSGFQPTFSTSPTAWKNEGDRYQFGWQDFKHGPDRVSYGTVDLSPTLGIPAKMNMLSTNEGQITFTIDYQGDFAGQVPAQKH